MIKEIHRSEKITSTKKDELNSLYARLFDSRVGSKEWNSISKQIEVSGDETDCSSFNPDARI